MESSHNYYLQNIPGEHYVFFGILSLNRYRIEQFVLIHFSMQPYRFDGTNVSNVLDIAIFFLFCLIYFFSLVVTFHSKTEFIWWFSCTQYTM